MKVEDIKKIAVMGAGDMGHGIAEVALLAGYQVTMRDIERKFVDRGLARIKESLDKLLEKQKITEDNKKAMLANIKTSVTSNMSITEIALATKRPQHVVGMHFFNPAVLMKLVEVIKGDKTSEDTIQLTYDLALKMKKVPVRVEKDSIGFIYNRINAPTAVLLRYRLMSV